MRLDPFRKLAFGLATLGFTALVSGAALADDAQQSPADAAEASKIAAAGHALKWNRNLPNRADRYGHSEILVHAPLATVRTVVLDHGHYSQLVPDKFPTSKVVAKENGNTDVYMVIPVMDGLIKLWAVERFNGVRVLGPGVEQVEGTLVKGNIKQFNPIFTMHDLGNDWTLLEFDLLVRPNFPAPQFALDEALRDAATDFIEAMHNRAQGTADWIPWSPAAVAATPQQPTTF